MQGREHLSESSEWRQPWKGMILPYEKGEEDEVGAQLEKQSAQGFKAELLSRQAKPKESKGAGEGKRMSLKEQRKTKSSMKKKHLTGYRQAKTVLKSNGCYGVGSREKSQNQKDVKKLCNYYFQADRNPLPRPYNIVLPEVALPSAKVVSSPSLGQHFEVSSRTTQSTKDHREKVLERARRVHHQRCLNRLGAYNESYEDRGERISTNKMGESRDIVKIGHKADLIKEAKQGQIPKWMKQNKVDKSKVVESELWTSDVAEDKSKMTKRKQTGKISNEKRKEKRKVKKEESSKLALHRSAQKEIEEVIYDAKVLNKSHSVELTEQDDLEAQSEVRNCENINSNDRNDSEREMGNITAVKVKDKNTIGELY